MEAFVLNGLRPLAQYQGLLGTDNGGLHWPVNKLAAIMLAGLGTDLLKIGDVSRVEFQ